MRKVTEKKLLTLVQVTERLQVTEHTVYAWLREDRLRGVRVGHLWRIREEDLVGKSYGVCQQVVFLMMV